MSKTLETVLPTVKNGNVTKLIKVSKKGTLVSEPKKATGIDEPKKAKEPKQVIYLKQGLTGKSLVSSKIDTNKAIKSDRKSFSSCLRDIIKNDTNFLNSFVGYQETDLTPKNLLPLLKNEEGKNGFSCWLLMQLITRYYKNI